MADSLPVKVKRELWRGDDRYWTHVFTVSGTTTPINITGWTFVSQYREDRNRGTVVASAVCSIIDGPGGILSEHLTNAQADLLPGQDDPDEKPVLYWDLQSTDTDGKVQTWQWAAVPVDGDASDA